MGFELDAKRGVLNHYGTRETNERFGGQTTNQQGTVKEAVWEVAYDKLPVAGADNLALSLPANSTIVGARFVTDVAFVGGTSYTVGLATSAGVAIDDDGLLTAANLPLANINAKGKTVVGTGALVNAPIGAAAGELVVAATGTFTAGRGRVIVQYIK
jgi:hypothetical protein